MICRRVFASDTQPNKQDDSLRLRVKAKLRMSSEHAENLAELSHSRARGFQDFSSKHSKKTERSLAIRGLDAHTVPFRSTAEEVAELSHCGLVDLAMNLFLFFLKFYEVFFIAQGILALRLVRSCEVLVFLRETFCTEFLDTLHLQVSRCSRDVADVWNMLLP